jgi:methionyl-tRNA formyltransferase
MRVVFWGSPEFAVAVLEALIASAHELAGVVTRPAEPGGRGRRPKPTPVARLAESAGLPAVAPKRLRGNAIRAELAALGADVFVVAAYGAILPPDILSLPPHGSLNVHASLLPEYRGAAPVTRAILDGKRESGVTIMRMDEGLDTGAICLQMPEPVLESDTAETLTGRLAVLGGRAAVEALDRLEAGTLTQIPQNEARASYAAKVTTAEARIDWSLPAATIARAARAFDPWPGAWTTFRGERLKVFRVGMADEAAIDPGGPAQANGGEGGGPGRIVSADPAPVIRTGDGFVRLDVVQPSGGRRMAAGDWARGRGVHTGETLG